MATTKAKKAPAPQGPKGVYADPNFIFAFLTQLIGRLISMLMKTGIVEKGAEALTVELTKHLGQVGKTQTINVGIAGLQTLVRTYGVTFLPRNIIELIAEVLDEIGDGIDGAHAANKGILEADAAHNVVKMSLRNLEVRLNILTHAEALNLLSTQEQAELVTYEAAFKQQGGADVILWNEVFPQLRKTSELRLLPNLSLEQCRTHLQQKLKNAQQPAAQTSGGFIGKILGIFSVLKGPKVAEIKKGIGVITHDMRSAQRGKRVQRQYMEEAWHTDNETSWGTVFLYLCLVIAVQAVSFLIIR